MPIPKMLLLLQAGIFGLIFGSFLNVCIYRIPKSLSILGRSFCPKCAHPIPMYRNVPVFSYLLQGGKSACCRQKISPQYPLIELLTGVISIATMLHSGSLTEYFLWFILFMCPLIVISIIDFQLKIIPDVISLPFILVGIAVVQYQEFPHWWEALKFSGIGILGGGGSLLLLAEVMSRLLKKDAMGGGDIKLTAMLGAFLGFKALVFIFFVSSVLALVYAILSKVLIKNKDPQIPFGPFLSMGGIIFWLYGHALTDFYFLEIMKLPTNPFFA